MESSLCRIKSCLAIKSCPLRRVVIFEFLLGGAKMFTLEPHLIQTPPTIVREISI